MKNEVLEKWLKAIFNEYLKYEPLMKRDGSYIDSKEIIEWLKAQPNLFPNN